MEGSLGKKNWFPVFGEKLWVYYKEEDEKKEGWRRREEKKERKLKEKDVNISPRSELL